MSFVMQVKGHVTGKDTGQPVVAATVHVSYGNEYWYADTVTDGDGYYEFLDVHYYSGGIYTITVSAAGYKTATWEGQFNVIPSIVNIQLEKVISTPTIPTPPISGGAAMTMIAQIRSQVSARRTKLGIPSLGILPILKTTPVTQTALKTTIKTF